MSERIALATEFLTRLGRLDAAGVAELLTPDAVMILPFLDAVPDVLGREAIVRQIETTMQPTLESMHFTFDAWHETAGGDVVIGEYRSRCPLLAGGVYENAYVGFFTFDGDRIAGYKEYLNPLAMAAAFGALAGPA